MQRYRNLGGNSGVSAYDIDADRITVRFDDGAIYLYTYASAGSMNVEQMKQLAVRGMGLNSFINRTVRKRYAAKVA